MVRESAATLEQSIGFVDNESRNWQVRAFNRSPVGPWPARQGRYFAREMTVVFRCSGEERVALTSWSNDWHSDHNLQRLFARATERRSREDSRVLHVSVAADRRSSRDPWRR